MLYHCVAFLCLNDVAQAGLTHNPHTPSPLQNSPPLQVLSQQVISANDWTSAKLKRQRLESEKNKTNVRNKCFIKMFINKHKSNKRQKIENRPNDKQYKPN